VKLAIVQTKPRKGDVAANLVEMRAVFAQLAAEPEPYDLAIFPEAALTGYFLEGAVYELAFEANDLAAKLHDAWKASGNAPLDVVIGFFENAGGTYYNAAMYVTLEAAGPRIVHVHRKMFLPTYGVFDEERFLSRGKRLAAFDTAHGRMAILICEDAWHAIVPTLAAIRGAHVLIIPSASPGRGLAAGTGALENVGHWRNVLASYAVEHGVFVLYAGLVGFEGGKGMSGSSMVIDPFGATLATLPALGASILRATIDLTDVEVARASLPLLGDLAAVLPDLLV
jgi:predicted amidohydrolase